MTFVDWLALYHSEFGHKFNHPHWILGVGGVKTLIHQKGWMMLMITWLKLWSKLGFILLFIASTSSLSSFFFFFYQLDDDWFIFVKLGLDWYLINFHHFKSTSKWPIDHSRYFGMMLSLCYGIMKDLIDVMISSPWISLDHLTF